MNDHELNCGGFGKQQDNNGESGRDQTNKQRVTVRGGDRINVKLNSSNSV